MNGMHLSRELSKMILSDKKKLMGTEINRKNEPVDKD